MKKTIKIPRGKNQYDFFKNSLRESNNLSENEKINLIKDFFIMMNNNNKIRFLDENDIHYFIDMVKKENSLTLILIEQIKNFISEDFYDEKYRYLKDILYKYIIETYYTIGDISIFSVPDEIKKHKKGKNLIKRQHTFFIIIKNFGMYQGLKRRLFNQMVKEFDKSIANYIKEYIDSYEIINKNNEPVLVGDIKIDKNFNMIQTVDYIYKDIDKYISDFRVKDESSTKEDSRIHLNFDNVSINGESRIFKERLLYYYSLLLSNSIDDSKYLEIKMYEDFFDNEGFYFINNILFFIEHKKYYHAFKEVIIFFEYSLRNNLEKNKTPINSYKYNKEDQEKSFSKFIEYIKEDNKKRKKYANIDSLKNEYFHFMRNEEDGNISLNSLTLKNLIDVSVNNDYLTKNESFFIKFLLLNDKGEGENFRNDILHGIKNEYFYYNCQNKEDSEKIFLLTFFYIFYVILKIKKII